MWALVLDTCNLIHGQFNSREEGFFNALLLEMKLPGAGGIIFFYNRVYTPLLASDLPLVLDPPPTLPP